MVGAHGRTSSPAQASCQVISSPEGQHSHWWAHRESFFVWNSQDFFRVTYKVFVTYTTLTKNNNSTSTYCIQEPTDGAVASTHQDPVFMEISEEV